jgi:branched-chain amino acid transport system ATP-binding protein
MLAIARALMSSPKLLLLDEPALGLAPLIIQNIFATISKISREDKVTIFLVEQNAKMALSISDKGYVMETGNIILEDLSKNLLENPKVKAAYLGE